MPDVLQKEGSDRTEMITGAAELIKRMANRNLPITTVKESPMRDIRSDDGVSAIGSVDTSSDVHGITLSDRGSIASRSSRSSSPSDDDADEIGPDDSISVVSRSEKKSHKDHKHPKKLTGEALKREKAFALWKYKKCNPDFRYSPVHLSMSNTLEEIEDELSKVKEENSIDNAVDIARSSMVSIAGLIEFLSKKQNVFDLRLNGWSGMIACDIEGAKYDGVFSEIYEDMRGAFDPPPWAKLILMVGGSAVTFHGMQKYSAMFNIKPNAPLYQEQCEQPSVDINDILSKMRAQAKKTSSLVSEQSSELSESSSTKSVASWISSNGDAESVASEPHIQRAPPSNQPQNRKDLASKKPPVVRGDRVSKLRSTLQQKRAEATPDRTRLSTIPVHRAVRKPVMIPQKAASISILKPQFDPCAPRLGEGSSFITEIVEETTNGVNGANEDVEFGSEFVPPSPKHTIVTPDASMIYDEPVHDTPPPAPPTVKPKRVYKRKTQPTDAAPKQKKPRKINENKPFITEPTSQPEIGVDAIIEQDGPHPQQP